MSKSIEANEPSRCPVCGGIDHECLFPKHHGICITSDLAVLPNATLDNRCCKNCGLIFNACGTRGFTEEFYRDSYSLMMRKESSAIQSFAGPKPMSQAEKSLHVLQDAVPLEIAGDMLELGAGKGEFLEYFVAARPAWTITAFEPSEAFRVLQSRFPSAKVAHGGYKDFQGNAKRYDLLVALGVLEHVDNPLDMLRWGWHLLKDGGTFFIRVPNFGNNPNDLFCADHLSKLTISTLHNIAGAAGFDVLSVKQEGVPVFFALRKVSLVGRLTNDFDSNLKLAQTNIKIAKSGISAVQSARKNAIRNEERFGIFGLGSSGLFAPFYFDFPPSEITAYIDENSTMWGSEVHGRPIGGLEIIERLNIKHIALALSPVYVAKVMEKLKPCGAQVYADVS